MQQSSGIILLFSALLLIHSSSAFADTFPRKYTADEALSFFSRHTRLVVNRTQRSVFTLEVKGNKATRDCGLCNITMGYGSIRYESATDRVCLYWDNVSYPDSGCFTLVQTGVSTFALQTSNGKTPYLWQAEVSEDTSGTTAVFERAILVDLTQYRLGPAQIDAAIKRALYDRGWQLISTGETGIVASIVRSETEYRLLVQVKDAWVAVGYVKGFSPSGDNWLWNIRKSILSNVHH